MENVDQKTKTENYKSGYPENQKKKNERKDTRDTRRLEDKMYRS